MLHVYQEDMGLQLGKKVITKISKVMKLKNDVDITYHLILSAHKAAPQLAVN